MFERIAGIVFPIYCVVAVGYAYGRWKKPDMAFANQLNMDVFVPALVFAALAAKSYDLADVTTDDQQEAPQNWASGKFGWRYHLKANERMLRDPLVFDRVAYFKTYEPTNSAGAELTT